MKLSTKITIGLILGILFGVVLNVFFSDRVSEIDKYVLSPVGEIFLRGIQFVVVPLVFTSLIVGFSSIKNTEKVGRLTMKILGLYVVTNVIALVIGLITAQVIQPGKNVGEIGDVEAQEAAEGQGLMEWFISIIPTNP